MINDIGTWLILCIILLLLLNYKVYLLGLVLLIYRSGQSWAGQCWTGHCCAGQCPACQIGLRVTAEHPGVVSTTYLCRAPDEQVFLRQCELPLCLSLLLTLNLRDCTSVNNRQTLVWLYMSTNLLNLRPKQCLVTDVARSE